MSDITIIWSADRGRGDWQLLGQQLQTGSDLENAILISLFTDRQANPDDTIPDGSTDRRGWWGDLGAAVPVGSRLWLLDRAKQTAKTLQDAYDYLAEALQWLIDDGIVAKFDIYCEWSAPGRLGAQIIAHRQDGANLAMNFSWVWKN
jgi:phage gp46-like protein